MKISKALIQTIMVAVTVGATVACTKSVDSKQQNGAQKNQKTDSTLIIPDGCPACGMG